MATRCINFDWIEVFCLELGEPKTPEYFQLHGFRDDIKVRNYGTPQYRQMFTLYNKQFPLVEIRRDPYSIRPLGGIFDPRACHLRLSNRACYLPDPIAFLKRFMEVHGFAYQNTSRLDICLDFQHFDNNDNPANFLRDYFANKYTKVHQPRFSAYGLDKHDIKTWQSVKWGSNTSSLTTKMYNKSLELQQVEDKPYIRQQWEACGFNPLSDTWRIEFSIKSEYKNMARLDVEINTGEIVRNVIDIDIQTFANRDFMLFTWFAIADYYLDFRYVEYNRNGILKRKYDCERKVLFRTKGEEKAYHPTKLTMKKPANRTDYMLIKKLQAIVADCEHYTYNERIGAAATIDGIVRNIAADRINNRSQVVMDPIHEVKVHSVFNLDDYHPTATAWCNDTH